MAAALQYHCNSDKIITAAGMAASEVVMKRVKRTGVGIIQPDLGLDALASILATGLQPHALTDKIAVVPFDWEVMLKVGLPREEADKVGAILSLCMPP